MRLLGYGVEDLLGTSVTDLLPPRARRRFQSYIDDVISSPSEVSGVIPLFTKDRARLLVVEFRSSLVVEDGHPVAVRGIARNVTERVDYERALRTSRRRTESLLKESQAMQERLAQLTRQIIHIQEEDRGRISRELHDEIGQLLAAITVNIEIMKKTIGERPDMVRARMDDTQQLTRSVMDRVHQVLQELRPVMIDQSGLLSLLRQYAKSFSSRTNLPVNFVEETAFEELDRNQKVAIYRVVQESLTNIAQHAGASHVTIDCGAEAEAVVMEILDDGRGFVASEATSTANGRPCLGVLGMQERIKQAGGEFHLTSQPGRGTRIWVRIPKEGSGDHD
jgi:PAS domain S-box-containing protein